MLFQAIATFIILPQVYGDIQMPSFNPVSFIPTQTIGDCEACKLFVKSFKKGIHRTSNGKFEGGNTAWEQEKLKKSYKYSEMRLEDVQATICKDVKDYSAQCYLMAGKAEEFIEEWWEKDPDDVDNLYKYICIENIKMCCPKLHYGKDCSPCLGDHTNLCNGRGKCLGDGTREGNGTCLCKSGYAGYTCEVCAENHYEVKNNDGIECKPCHEACLDSCRGDSSKDCVACKPGYKLDTYNGCLDINECETIKCKRNHFCVNTIGSYQCVKCHPACDLCYGDGPDMCRKCAKGFYLDKDLCIPDGKVDEEDERHGYLTNARYLTYAGMLVVACIVMSSSSTWGAAIASVTFTYMFIAEYYCMINGHQGILVNLRDYDLMRIFRP